MRGSKARSGLQAITDPAVYQRVADLFSRAVELPHESRAAFLKEHCGSDTELLRVLETLLREDEKGLLPDGAPGEPAEPVQSDGDPLSGRTLSHYQIVGPIAAGGMGVVYRAMDTRLERIVALKFLPPSLTEDGASRERFVREAKAIASVDHQNVCPIYDFEEADGLIFIVMACLEGATLNEKLGRGRLPVSEAIEIALQTARGLQAAHAKGIVHRDIKPENLMLAERQGAPALLRILDFGIAQWTEKSALTQQGLTIGTVSYLAPEQIGQSRVDARADIWSLGVVLYRMLAGHLPFEGPGAREVLAQIAGPIAADLTALTGTVPAGVVAALRKALEKNPEQRCQTAGEFIAELEAARRGGTGGKPSRRGRLGRTTRHAVWAGLVLACLSATALLLRNRSKGTTEFAFEHAVPFTFYPGYQEEPAISPDGKAIAFVGQGKSGANPREVYVQLMGSTDPLRLTRVEGKEEDRSPVWDPGATHIAFLRTRANERFARILTIPALGGSETDMGVAEVLGTGRVAWSPDGRTLAYTGSTRSKQGAIFEISLADRGIRQRSFPASGQTDCCPQYDSSSKRLAFKRNEVEIVVTGANGGPERALPARASWPGLTWTADGRALVYSWFGRLAEVNAASGSVNVPATSLGNDICDIVIRGRQMAYVRWSFEHSIWRMDLGQLNAEMPHQAAGPAVQVIASTMRDDTPQFSPDGKWIAFASERSGSTDIWVGRRDGAELRRLTFLDGQSAGTPRWSPDNSWIAFDLRPPSGKPDVWLVRASGGNPKRLANNPDGADLPSWSQDGRWVYYHARSDGQIWKRPWQGGQAVQVTRRGGFESFESADGRYLYYSRGEDRPGIWRADLRSGDEAQIPELSATGAFRHWAVAPSGVYFVPDGEAFSKDGAVRYFQFATRKTMRVGTVGKLVTAGPGALAVSRDESVLLFVHLDRDNRNIMVAESSR